MAALLDQLLHQSCQFALRMLIIAVSRLLRLVARTVIYAAAAFTAVGPLLVAFYAGTRLSALAGPLPGIATILGLTFLWCQTLEDIARFVRPYAVWFRQFERAWAAWEKDSFRGRQGVGGNAGPSWRSRAGDGGPDSRR